MNTPEIVLAVLGGLVTVTVAVVKYAPRVKDIRDAKKIAPPGISKREFDQFQSHVTTRFDGLEQDIREVRRILIERF